MKSKIHINPKNKGKFNATKKATGKTTEELTHSKNPVTRKRAIFAQNAKKWKHAEGGLINGLEIEKSNDKNYDAQLKKFIDDYNRTFKFAIGGTTDDSQATLDQYDQNVANMQIPGEYNPSQFQTLQPAGDQRMMPSPITGDLTVNGPVVNQNLTNQVKTYNNSPEHKKFAKQMYRKDNNVIYDPTATTVNLPVQGQGPYFQQSFAELNRSINASNAGEGVTAGILSGMDMGKGILKAVGDYRQNKFTNQWHNDQLNDQLSGTKRDSYTTFKPEDMFGQMKNPLQNAYGGKTRAYDEGGMIPGGIKTTMPTTDNANDFKVPFSKDEIEGGEVVQTSQGLIQKVNGPTHEKGGIPFDAPDTKVLTNRLKFQFKPGEKPKTFADEAAKYSTDKDLENLNMKYADSITKTTSDLNLKFKNDKVAGLYDLQEMGKAIGHFPGISEKVQKAALGGYLSKFADGGETKWEKYINTPEYKKMLSEMEGDPNKPGAISKELRQHYNDLIWENLDKSLQPDALPINKGLATGALPTTTPMAQNIDPSYSNNFVPITPHDSTEYNGVTPTGIAHHDKYGRPLVSNNYWETGRDQWQDWANKKGQAIPKTNRGANTDYQEYIYDNLLDTPQGRDQIRNMWAEFGTTNKDKDKFKKYDNFSKLSDQDLKDLRANFIDSKIESRYLRPADNGENPATANPGDALATSKMNRLGTGITATKAKRAGFNLMPLPIVNSYQLDPLQTSKLNPHLIQYRPTDIEPAIAEANRGFRATTRSLDSSPTGLANDAQSFANSWRAKQGVFADNFNRSQQGRMGVDEFNSRELSRVDSENLNERNRFMDLINRGKGVIDTQRRTDEQGAIQNYYNANEYANSANYINNTFGPRTTAYNYIPNQINGLIPPNYAAGIKNQKKYVKNSDGTYSETTTQTETAAYGGKIGKKSMLRKKVKK